MCDGECACMRRVEPHDCRCCCLCLGYVGEELLRCLAQHPTFGLLAACAAGRAGEPFAQVHPQFAGTSWAQMVLDETTPDLLNQADLVFLALPHGESAAIVQALDADVRAVGFGADFRLASAEAWITYSGVSLCRLSSGCGD